MAEVIEKAPPVAGLPRAKYGPAMEDLNIALVQNLPVKLEHDGPVDVTVHDDAGKSTGILVRYQRGSNTYQAHLQKNINDVTVCRYCTDTTDVAWCSHIHYVLTGRLDYPIYQELGRFIIPIVPTEGVFCPVHLEETEVRNGRPLVRAFMVMENSKTSQDEQVTLGFLKRGGFGTTDLRNLFSDWAIGQFDNDTYFLDPHCMWPSHSDNNPDYARLSDFSKLFYRSMYGMCPPCMNEYRKSSDPTKDAPQF